MTAFFPFISSEIGWSRSIIGAAQTLAVLIYALMVPLSGWLTDRVGSRRTILIGGLINLGGWISISAITSPWQLYLYYSFTMGIAVSLCHYVPIQATVRKWFKKRAGLVGGILIAAFAVGTAIFMPLMTEIAGSLDWRRTSLLCGFVFGFLILLLTLFVIRDTPESMGLSIDGEGFVQPLPGEQAIVGEDWSAKEALKTRQYWLLFVTYSFQGIPINGLLAHLVIWGVDLGSDIRAAGIFMTGLTLPMAIAAPLGGWLGDRHGKRLIIAVSNLCCLLLMVLAWQGVHTAPKLVIFSIAIGFGLNLQIGLFSPYLGDLFGRANIGFLYGIITTGWGLIGGSGAFLWGVIYDTTGSYHLACFFSIICYAIAFIAVLLIQPIGSKRGNIQKQNVLDD